MQQRKSREPFPIQAVLSTLFRSGAFGSTREQAAMRAWKDVAGDAVRSHTRPVRMQRGTLTVEVDSAPYMYELRRFRGEEIRRRINGALGSAEVERIVFRPRS